MKLAGEQVLLRVYLTSTDRASWFAAPAADALVRRARAAGLAGATLLHGTLGLGASGRLTQSAPWALAEHVPVILEIVDSAPAIGRFLPTVAAAAPHALVTLERAHVLLYRHAPPAAGGLPASPPPPGPVVPFSSLPSPEEFPAMKDSTDGQLVRIFIGDSDAYHGQPLARAIVLKARELGLAGATVLRGPMGFGAHSRVHTANILELSADLPVVIEIVDRPAKIAALLPFLDEAVAEGLITIEEVRVLRYRPGSPR